MAFVSKPSTPEHAKEISALLSDVLEVAPDSPELQRWKYWGPHPLWDKPRSYVLLQQEAVVAHGFSWPVRLQGRFGEMTGMFWHDWVARNDAAGAGIQSLSQRRKDAAALFAIGGTDFTRKILPAMGYKAYNNFCFLHRPLRPVATAWQRSPHDWKAPLRIARNFVRAKSPTVKMRPGWSYAKVTPEVIPAGLFPRSQTENAIAERSAELLAYMMRCPAFEQTACYLLNHGGAPVAYFFLASREGRLRLVDYGPNDLSEETAKPLATAAQLAAQSDFPAAIDMVAATTEPAVLTGFLQAGLHRAGEEPIWVLKVNQALDPTQNFRLTLMDWDACIL